MNYEKRRYFQFFLMLCVMIGSLFTFTGCNLYHDNNKRVNEEVVAKVGDEVVTRNELTTWFNYYYYSSGLYYQYTEEEVYDLALNNLVKFKLIINEAKHTDEIFLTVTDQNKIWEQVFDYLDQTLDSYEKEIRDRYGLEMETEEDAEETEKDLPVYKPYERAEISYSIDYEHTDTVLNNVYAVPAIEENYYRYLAYQKYRAEITKTANEYSSRELTEDEAWNEEINRYYKYYEDRAYVKKYNDYCLDSLNISDEAIVNAYINDLNTQLQDFTINDSYLSTLTSTSNSNLVLYHQAGGSFSVQQIVLGFDDMISVTHNNSTMNISEHLSSYLNSGFIFDASESKTEENEAYLEAREDYALNVEGSLNMTYIDPETGKTTDEDGNEIEKTYQDFCNELSAITVKYNESITALGTKYNPSTEADKIAAEKLQIERTYVQDFYKLKFSYSKDSNVTDLTSLFNKVGYIFPEYEEDMTTSWVSEFTDAAYELYDTYKDNGTFGVKTFVSNYGVHVMIFAGEIEAGAIAEKNIESLESTYVSYATDQTVADYYHDKLLANMQTAGNNDSAYYLQTMLGSNISSVLYERVTSILFNQYTVAEMIDIKYPKYEDIL